MDYEYEQQQEQPQGGGGGGGGGEAMEGVEVDPAAAGGEGEGEEGYYEGMEDGGGEGGEEMLDEEDMPVTQEDAWAVISAYFEEKGLVRQQLDSFDEFIQNTMQELVDDSGDIRVSPEIQHMVGYDDEAYDREQERETKTVFEIHFGQVYLSKPTTVEKDGTG